MKNKKFFYVLKVLESIVIISLFVAVFLSVKEGLREDYTDTDVYLERWEMLQDDGTYKEVTLPVTIDKETITLRTELKTVNSDKCITIDTKFSELYAYIDGELIYSAESGSLFGCTTSVGNYVVFIPLREDYSGKTLTVEITKRQQIFKVHVNEAVVCTRASYIVSSVISNINSLVIAIVMTVFGIVFFFIWFINLIKRNTERTNVFNRRFSGYASIFMLSVGIWIIGDSHIVGIISSAQTLSGVITYYSFMLIPIAGYGIVMELAEHKVKGINIALLLSVVNVLLQTFIFIVFKLDYPVMITLTHLFCIGVLIYAGIVTRFLMKKGNAVEKNIVVPGMYVTLTLLLVSINVFGFDLKWKPIFNIALIVFVILIEVIVFNGIYVTLKDNILLDEMKKYAYTDEMTGLYNRRAFTEEIERIERQKETEDLAFIAFDLNGLKKANDNIGHHAGDELIKATADCIKEAFSNKGKFYRVGGDEFYAIVFLSKKEVKKALDAFDLITSNCKGNYYENLSVSYGAVYYEDHKGIPLYELIKISDSIMYNMKENYYKTTGHDRRKND